jgi:hypothetical protein
MPRPPTTEPVAATQTRSFRLITVTSFLPLIARSQPRASDHEAAFRARYWLEGGFSIRNCPFASLGRTLVPADLDRPGVQGVRVPPSGVSGPASANRPRNCNRGHASGHDAKGESELEGGPRGAKTVARLALQLRSLYPPGAGLIPAFDDWRRQGKWQTTKACGNA